MGDTTFQKLIKTVVLKCGIDRSNKSTSNQSLRTTVFNAQDMIGMTGAQKRLISGHVSEKTAEIYTR